VFSPKNEICNYKSLVLNCIYTNWKKKKSKPESFYLQDCHIIDSKNTISLKPAFKVLFYLWYEKGQRFHRWKGTKYVFRNFICLYSEHIQLSRTCNILAQHGYPVMSILYLSTIIHFNLEP
jgi:hypothetical protein